MKISDIYQTNLFESTKKLGRTFNHLEDLVFFHGTDGVGEIIRHITELGTPEGSSSLRMKWDGSPQLYFGRDEDGKFVLVGHNGWSRKIKPHGPEDLYNFIAHESGKTKTPEEQQSREEFALQISQLWPMFEKAVPTTYRGYVYADALFLKRPDVDKEGIYNFCPNPKSKTCYHVRANSELGRRINQADAMVVGHAFFPEFGLPDDKQQPISDFSRFNSNPDLIVLGPIYNRTPITIDVNELTRLKNTAEEGTNELDGFLQSLPGLSDLRQIIYKYINTKAKQEALDHISRADFIKSLQSLGVSPTKQTRVEELDKEYPRGLDVMMNLIRQTQKIKDHIIDQVEQGASTTEDIWDTHGEGRVRYVEPDNRFGHIKLVPRKRWKPS